MMNHWFHIDVAQIWLLEQYVHYVFAYISTIWNIHKVRVTITMPSIKLTILNHVLIDNIDFKPVKVVNSTVPSVK